MRPERKRLVLGLLAFVVVVGCAGLWWASQRLTPLEKDLVGRWYRLVAMKPSGHVLVLMEFDADRTMQVGQFQWPSGEARIPYKLVGRWRVEGDTLIWDWERRFGHRITRRSPLAQDWAERWLPGWKGGLIDMHESSDLILSHTADEIDLYAGGESTTLKRYTGGLQLPSRTLPRDQ